MEAAFFGHGVLLCRKAETLFYILYLDNKADFMDAASYTERSKKGKYLSLLKLRLLLIEKTY
jgi:hypothetical protein